jgi:uncharacterized protein YkwD
VRSFCFLLFILIALPLTPAHAEEDWNDAQFYRQAQEYMLASINKFRGKKGVPPVQLDITAGQLAKGHAEDMLGGEYFSHWDLSGNKPTRRWNMLGGFDSVSENIYYYGGTWPGMQRLIDDAMKTLMNSSGHRATIMDPAHTHVGLGFAVDPRARKFYVDQEFVTRAGGDYNCPDSGTVGDTVDFTGQFDPEHYAFEQVILGYEELPQARSQKWLNSTESYSDADRLVAGFSTDRNIRFNGMATYNDVSCNGGCFTCHAKLDFKGQEGLYYLFLWLRDKRTGQPFMAATATVEARR